MRTKQLLTALCIPMAFAACSNEDFVNETPALESRGTVNVSLNASKPTIFDADTKMSIDENNNFLWEKDVDMIGAAMADGGTFDQIQTDHKVWVNYPFTAQNSGVASAFNAKSSIAKGNYLFYYGYTDVLDRGYLDLSTPAQVYDADSEKSAMQQAAGQMKMIAPIVNLADGVGYEDAKDYDLNLEFVNLYAMVKLTINSTNIPTGTTPKLKKITLDAVDGSTTTKGFVKKAHASLTGIAGTQKANVVTPDATSKQLDADDVKAAKENLEKLLAAAGNASATVGDITVADGISTIYDQTDITGDENKYGPVTLSVKGELALSAAKPTVMYLLVPKGTYNNGLELKVETSEGTYSKTISKPATGNLTLGNEVQRMSADLDFKLDGTGNVTLPKAFDIESADEWTSAVDFLTNHAVGYINEEITFTLKNDIEIPALPVFKLKIEGDKTLTLTGNYTINAQNANQFTATDVTLGVKNGATLTLDADADAFAAIINNGTLNVKANQSKKITNLGTMNVNDNATLTGGLDNGKAAVANPATPAVNGIVTVAAEKTLTINGTAKLDNIAGTITVNKDGDKVGKLVVNVASDNKGTITNNGEISGSAAITSTGTIDNFGALIADVTNNGKVIVEKESEGTATITGGTVEVKDVTTFKATQKGNKKYTFAGQAVVTTLANNKAECDAAGAEDIGITNITLNGGAWTLKSTAGEATSRDIAVSTLTNVGGVTLKGATLALEVGLDDKDIIVEGTSTISAAAAQTITKASLTVAKEAVLTVNKNVTVNKKVEYTGYTATVLGTLNVEAGAAMYFETATVGSADSSAGKVSVKGNTATVNEPGVFGVNTQASFANYGTVESLKGSGTAAAAGKVTQPVNKTDAATFKGNAASDIFL